MSVGMPSVFFQVLLLGIKTRGNRWPGRLFPQIRGWLFTEARVTLNLTYRRISSAVGRWGWKALGRRRRRWRRRVAGWWVSVGAVVVVVAAVVAAAIIAAGLIVVAPRRVVTLTRAVGVPKITRWRLTVVGRVIRTRAHPGARLLAAQQVEEKECKAQNTEKASWCHLNRFRSRMTSRRRESALTPLPRQD